MTCSASVQLEVKVPRFPGMTPHRRTFDYRHDPSTRLGSNAKRPPLRAAFSRSSLARGRPFDAGVWSDAVSHERLGTHRQGPGRSPSGALSSSGSSSRVLIGRDPSDSGLRFVFGVSMALRSWPGSDDALVLLGMQSK